MKYENARDILPDELFKELQRYAAGKLLYVPSPAARIPWGVRTGYRRQLEVRNGEIRKRFIEGASIDRLADEYFLTPETIKKIVYSKKEKYPMELNEIIRLYSNEQPISTDIVFEEDRESDGLLFVTADVVFRERTIRLNVCDYVFGSEARIEQAARTIEAYRKAGINALPMIPDVNGKIASEVSFRGRECTVFATERPDTESDCPIGEAASLIWRDEYLDAAAKIASLCLEGKEKSAFEFYEPITAAEPDCEDYVLEYFHDLKKDVERVFPEMLGKISDINRVFNENRRALYRLWDRLPKSCFNGEINDFGINADGRLKEIREFIDGGRETNVCYLFRLAFWLADMEIGGKQINACTEVYDKELREARLRALCRNIGYIAQRYRFTDEEIEAAPYVYKSKLISTHYYWEIMRFADGDEKKMANFSDFLERRLRSDEIDFGALMRI